MSEKESPENKGFMNLINEHSTTIIAICLSIATIMGSDAETLEDKAQNDSEIAQQNFKDIEDDDQDCMERLEELEISKIISAKSLIFFFFSRCLNTSSVFW